MPNDNRISATLNPSEKAAFLQALADARQILSFAVNLTAAERQSIQSIGDQRAGMLTVFPQLMKANPTLVPGFVNMTEVEKDVVLIRDLMVFKQTAAMLLEAVSDTLKACSADTLKTFTGFYAVVGEARRHNVPGADTLYDELSPFFAKRRKKTARKKNEPS